MNLRILATTLLVAALGLHTSAQNQIDNQGRKQGHWIRADKNGAKIFEGTFKDNKETGTFTYYYPNGNVRMRNVFTDPGRYCSHEAFDEEGHRIATGFYNQKNRDSIWHFYNEQGALVKVAGFRMGVKQGADIIFNSHGDTAEYTTWNNNHRNGRWWKRIGEHGYITGTYLHGGLDGRLLEYDEGGKLCREGHYTNGNKNGTYKYYENGVLAVDEVWTDGSLSSRKILITAPEKQYIDAADIAYLLPVQKEVALYRMDGSMLKCKDDISQLTDRIGLDNFILIDAKRLIIANISCIKGITHDAEGREVLALDPKPDFEVFPDDECKKMVESILRSDEEGMNEDGNKGK